jgi:hypothetical protein
MYRQFVMIRNTAAKNTRNHYKLKIDFKKVLFTNIANKLLQINR